MNNRYTERILIVITVFLIISVKYQMWQIDKTMLEQNERTNKIIQRNYEFYLDVVKENIKLRNEINNTK